MSAKKRKPLDSVLEEFVFGTKEAAPTPTEPEVGSPVLAPTALSRSAQKNITMLR